MASSSSSGTTKVELARVHIEDIRRNKFSIGQGVSNPLIQDLHNAVRNLSLEIYSKDVHFLMEIIQNAEENEYPDGVEPALEFVLTDRDVTGLGAAATLLIFNNEVGFSKDNIDSLCGVGRSTKKDQQQKGFIGEKGIGFKSLFSVSAQPHIFSNGYQIKFNEVPNHDCDMGYIVPEWLTSQPYISGIQQIYGLSRILPATIIILPLKDNKLNIVKKHLLEIHPEILLFLHKIRYLSVRENSHSSVDDSMSTISMASEINIVPLKTEGVDSRIVDLSVLDKQYMPESTCRYLIYSQDFPVDDKSIVDDSRKRVDEMVISLAFPFGDRLCNRGTSSTGIFAYLPTTMVTNFPFIVQADFVLASSRKEIQLDNKWNMGILEKVHMSFISAVMSMTCIKSTQMSELFPLPRILEFMLLKESPVKHLNTVRNSIRLKAGTKCIVPCETVWSEEIVLLKAAHVVRILPEFRKILSLVKDIISFDSVRCYGEKQMWYLHKSVETEKYDALWDFLGVHSVDDSYGSCLEFLQTNDILFRAPRQVYVDILCFFANNWKCLPSSIVRNIPIFKYIGRNEEVFSCTIEQMNSMSKKISFVHQAPQRSWLYKWNLEMECPGEYFFLEDGIVTAITNHKDKKVVMHWLNNVVGVKDNDVYSYCCHHFHNNNEAKKCPKLAFALTHLVYHSTLKGHLEKNQLPGLLKSMPVVDISGKVNVSTSCLVPASGSKWAKLFGIPENAKNSIVIGEYVELGEVYAEVYKIAGECTPEKELLNFLKEHGNLVDLFDILPPDHKLLIASRELTSDQALLLLEWIQCLRAKEGVALPSCNGISKYKIPTRFIESIKFGKWLKTSSGFSSPGDCYMCDGTESSMLVEIGRALKAIPAIDEEYYMNQIKSYRKELSFLGVKFRKGNMYRLIVDHIKAHGAPSINIRNAQLGIPLLKFIRYSNQNKNLEMEFLNILKEGKWLRTRKGWVTPSQAVYVKSDFGEAVSQITDLCVVDNSYYGNKLCKFVNELKLLGIITSSLDFYKLISVNFKFPEDLSELSKDTVLLSLKCIRKLCHVDLSLEVEFKYRPWIRTSLGLRYPSESLLLGSKWSGLDKIIPSPIIDIGFYGTSFTSYKRELEKLGVAVKFGQACNMVIGEIEVLLSSGGLPSEILLSILEFLKSTNTTMASQLSPFAKFISREKCFKTHHGYKYSCDCILTDTKWKTVSNFADLPFIDVAFYGDRIFSFKDQLKMLGVVLDFTDGTDILARSLDLPDDEKLIPADSVKSLLQCAYTLRHSTKPADQSLLKQFVAKLKGCKWVKTHMGYSLPEESLIMNMDWITNLEESDGPFIDRDFYGTLTQFEFDELKALGLKADTFQVCSKMFQNLPLHDETSAIVRILRFFCKEKWSLSSEGECTYPLWIPDRLGSKGKWVEKSACVLHDRDNLFSLFLHILDRHYDEEILLFMSTNFGVDTVPPLTSYIDLWASWVTDNHNVSFRKLNLFWQYISKNWEAFTEQNLGKGIAFVPATTVLGTVQLMARDEVFIPDDLQLKKAFSEVTKTPIFVWFPMNGSTSLTRLYEIYESIGVSKLSKSVQFSTTSNFEKLDSNGSLIGKPLIKIVSAFLASPAVNMTLEERQWTSKSLIDIKVYGTDNLIVDCSLHFPISKKVLNVEVNKLVVWDHDLLRLLVHKPSWNCRHIQKEMKFIFDFSQAISEMVLPNSTDLRDDLCQLIKMSFAFGFEEDEVNLLLALENLELSALDKDYLECLFPTVTSPASAKRPLPSCQTLESVYLKRQR